MTFGAPIAPKYEMNVRNRGVPSMANRSPCTVSFWARASEAQRDNATSSAAGAIRLSLQVIGIDPDHKLQSSD